MVTHAPPPQASLAGVSERLSCSLAAAQRFQVPANVVLAVASVENGRPGQWVPNTNGSFDLGAMQLNTAYIASLARFGIRPDHVLASGCYAYMLAAWRLHGHLAHDEGDPWRRVANYNSRTPIYNLRYQARLAPAAIAWRRWLEAYYPRLATIGGPELDAPVISPELFTPASLESTNSVRRDRRSGPRQANLVAQACGVACAPMRVNMVFKSPRAASDPAGPSG